MNASEIQERITPRRWQEEALTAWLSHGRGVLSVVTGAGKSAFALLAYAAAARHVRDLRLVVVVPTLASLDQWVVILETDAGFSQDEIGVFSGEERSSHPRQANIAVINTARHLADFFADGTPNLLVVDECHRAGAPENARALGIPHLMALGLSATPVREFDDGFERYIEPALGPVVYEYDYARARSEGVISPFDLHNFHFDLTTSEDGQYRRLSSRLARRLREADGDIHDPAVASVIRERSLISVSSPRRNAATVAVAERFPKPMIVFHERIDSAETISQLLDKRGPINPTKFS